MTLISNYNILLKIELVKKKMIKSSKSSLTKKNFLSHPLDLLNISVTACLHQLNLLVFSLFFSTTLYATPFIDDSAFLIPKKHSVSISSLRKIFHVVSSMSPQEQKETILFLDWDGVISHRDQNTRVLKEGKETLLTLQALKTLPIRIFILTSRGHKESLKPMTPELHQTFQNRVKRMHNFLSHEKDRPFFTHTGDGVLDFTPKLMRTKNLEKAYQKNKVTLPPSPHYYGRMLHGIIFAGLAKGDILLDLMTTPSLPFMGAPIKNILFVDDKQSFLDDANAAFQNAPEKNKLPKLQCFLFDAPPYSNETTTTSILSKIKNLIIN